MVSVYPNPLGADHKKMISSGFDDPNKKVRKPYTSWTEDYQLETDQQKVIRSGLQGPKKNMSWTEEYPLGADQEMMITSGFEGPNKKARKANMSWSEEYPLGADQKKVMSSGLEDPNKKVRKPYTITKSRESWTEEEHEKFIEALQLFDRDWKKIEAFVGSKSVIQIRSHAQKYFMKVQKTGAKEHVPPPRPKRKAAHPYPQKATKMVVSQATAMPQSSPSLVKLPNVMRSDCLLVPLKSSDPSNSIWTYNTAPAVSMSHGSKGNMVMSGAAMTSSSSGECSPKIWPSSEGSLQRKDQLQRPTTVIPDFAQVYRFLGSVFDPNAGDHLQRLQKMDPINIETVLTLMKNLSANLVSPAFEGHRQLLASHSSAGQEDQIVAASRRHLQAV